MALMVIIAQYSLMEWLKDHALHQTRFLEYGRPLIKVLVYKRIVSVLGSSVAD